MHTKNELLQNLSKVEHFSKAGKIQRFFRHPYKYIYALAFRDMIYPSTQKSKAVLCDTFYGVPIHLQLPAGTEIYLCKGKAHTAETKLARFLIQQLQPGDIFIDVGAHYGYFSLLAAQLVETTGKVFAFEAAPETYKCLQKNSLSYPQLQVFNQAISDTNSELVFYQFANLYSEYNSFNIDQYKESPWFANNQPQAINIPATTLYQFFAECSIHPQYIKIDVEGAELKVVKGALPYLKIHKPTLIMEYLSTTKNNSIYQKAEALLSDLNYKPNLINSDGALSPLNNVNSYLDEQGLDTENIVFIKR